MSIFKKLTTTGRAAVLALGTALPVFAADKLVITLDTPPGHIRTRMIKKFTETLGEKSNGALTFEVFDSNQLYS